MKEKQPHHLSPERKAPAPVIVNGELCSADTPIWPAAMPHGLRFGDGLFETMRWQDGTAPLWRYHWERLSADAARLGMQVPIEDALLAAMERLDDEIGQKNGIMRLQCFLSGTSHGYLPSAPSQPADWLLEYKPRISPPEHGITLYHSTIPALPMLNAKTMQGMAHRLAMQEAIANQCNQPLRVTADGMLSELGTGNLFFLRDDVWHTPSPNQAGVHGVMRRRIMDIARATVTEGTYSVDDLHHADAVCMSNAVHGIVPVCALHPHDCHWELAAVHAWQAELNDRLWHDVA